MRNLFIRIIGLFVCNISFSQVWINEIHYDDASTDANECIEIAGIAGTDMDCYSIALYNGDPSNNVQYDLDDLSGTIPNLSCGYGVTSLCYAVNGIQNGNPDGIALVYDPSNSGCSSGGSLNVIQFLSYGGVITATTGIANGSTSTNIGLTESGSINNSSLQLVGTGTTYSDFSWQAESPSIAPSFGSINTGQSFCPSSNTITTGTVSTSPFNITCLTGASGTVTFTATGTFNPGNIFTAQLSNSSGTFTTPISIGSLDSTSSVGTDPGGTINFTIPAETVTGSGYQIRIISTNPAITGSESAAFTINLSGGPCTSTPPHITSVIINSCNPTCTEGHNEMVFGNTGDFSVLVNTSNFDILYGSTYPLTNYTDVLTTNATTTSQINTAAGCSTTTFFDGTGLTLPPNSSFILAPTQLCEEALQWSGLCGSGPIYIIYHNDPSWNLGGTFKNGNTGGIRYFNSTISTTSGQTFSIDYNYNSTLLQTGAAGDGDYVTFGPNGGSAMYGDNNCVLTPVLLPTGLIGFSGQFINNEVQLSWKTASEINNDYFTVEHSIDGMNYEEIGTLKGAGSTDTEQHYSFVHYRPVKGINYYKLSSTDYDGTVHDKGIISVLTKIDGILYDHQTQSILFDKTSDYDVYSVEGKLILSVSESNNGYFDQSGIFIILDRRTGITHRLFIP